MYTVQYIDISFFSEFAGNLNTSETAPMTLLSVQLEEQNMLAQALQNQPEGKWLSLSES